MTDLRHTASIATVAEKKTLDSVMPTANDSNSQRADAEEHDGARFGNLDRYRECFRIEGRILLPNSNLHGEIAEKTVARRDLYQACVLVYRD